MGSLMFLFVAAALVIGGLVWVMRVAAGRGPAHKRRPPPLRAIRGKRGTPEPEDRIERQRPD